MFDVPSIFFFHNSYRLRAFKTFCFHFCNFIRKNEKETKRVFAKNFARFYEKKNTRKIRHLVDESFVQSAQQTSVLYCRLTDFYLSIQREPDYQVLLWVLVKNYDMNIIDRKQNMVGIWPPQKVKIFIEELIKLSWDSQQLYFTLFQKWKILFINNIYWYFVTKIVLT